MFLHLVSVLTFPAILTNKGKVVASNKNKKSTALHFFSRKIENKPLFG